MKTHPKKQVGSSTFINMEKLIAKIRNTRDYENLKERLGKELGRLIYQLVDEAEKADKELDIVHGCITELYNIELNIPRIKKALSDIEQL
jgi:hypothetical protein